MAPKTFEQIQSMHVHQEVILFNVIYLSFLWTSLPSLQPLFNTFLTVDAISYQKKQHFKFPHSLKESALETSKELTFWKMNKSVNKPLSFPGPRCQLLLPASAHPFLVNNFSHTNKQKWEGH